MLTYPDRVKKTCLTKRQYRNETAAQIAALRSCLKYEKPMRVYKCPYCLFFHLTSQVPVLAMR